MSSENELPPATGLVLTGDVVQLRREIRVLRQLNALLQRENTALRAALQAARLPHVAACPARTDATLPCGCLATQHNAAIDAVLATDH